MDGLYCIYATAKKSTAVTSAKRCHRMSSMFFIVLLSWKKQGSTGSMEHGQGQVNSTKNTFSSRIPPSLCEGRVNTFLLQDLLCLLDECFAVWIIMNHIYLTKKVKVCESAKCLTQPFLCKYLSFPNYPKIPESWRSVWLTECPIDCLCVFSMFLSQGMNFGSWGMNNFYTL